MSVLVVSSSKNKGRNSVICGPARSEQPAPDGRWTKLSSPTGVQKLDFPVPLASETQQYSAATDEVVAAAAAAIGGPQLSLAGHALERAEAMEWMVAMQEELAAHERHVIGCRWVFAKKRASDGTNLGYKARLAAQGFSQRPGVDYGTTFAPVVSADSTRYLLALAAEMNSRCTRWTW